MFDIGWTELLVVATVAILVVGPKDLPGMLRAFGRTMGQVRRMSNDFRRQFDEALREAERQSGLDETKKDLQSMTKADPLKDAQKDLDKSVRATEKPAAASKPAEASSSAAETTATEPTEAEPLKTGAASEPGTAA